MASKLRLIVTAALLFASGLLMVFALAWANLLSGETLLALLSSLDPLSFGVIFLLSLTNLGLVACKWHMIVGRIVPTRSPFGDYFILTVFSSALANVVPLSTSILIVRSLAMRVMHNMPLIGGAAVTVYDKAFDSLALAVFVPAAMTILLGGHVVVAAGLALLAPLVAAAFLLWGPPLLWHRLEQPRLRPAIVARTVELLSKYSGLREPRFLLLLFAISIARVAFLFVRVYFVALAAGLPLTLVDLAVAFPIAQISFVLALTPASLGILEWSWVGLLAALGANAEIAASFAVLLRVVIVLVLVPVLAIASVAAIIGRAQRRSQVHD